MHIHRPRESVGSREGGRRPHARFVVAAAFLFVLAVAAAAAPLAAPRIESTVAVDRDDKDEVKPGDVLTYTITTANKGEGIAREVAVINPVPPQTTCIPKSATGGDTKAVFSIDGGKTYASWPVRVRDEKTRKLKEVPPDQITHVKWALRKPLAPGKRVVVKYQVRVK